MADDATTPPQETPTRRPPKWLVIVSAMLAVAVGGGLGAMVVGPRMVKGAHAATASHGAAAATAGEKSRSASVVHLMENLVLNPAGTGGTRFLMVSVAIETKDAATNDEMNARDAEVRDLTLRLLGSKTVDQLADVTQRDAIRHELLSRLRTLFAPGAIRQIYFPQFVIQ